MEIRVLELSLYVEKYVERPRSGCRYLVEGGLVYREKEGESEDIAAVPSEWECCTLPELRFDGGTYLGEPRTIERLRALARRIEADLERLEAGLRE